MTHKDDVSGLPADAPQLATLADPVYHAVTSGMLDDVAAQFTDSGGKVAASVNKVRSAVSKVDGAWDGASSDGFVNYMSGFTTSGLSLSDALTNAGSDLENAGATVVGARDALEGIFANLVTEVESLGVQGDAGEVAEKVNEVVARHRPQVQAQVDNANEALTNAASALSGRSNEINPKFSTMPDPGTGMSVPNSGTTPMDWVPVPSQSPGPDGNDGSGGSPGGGSPGGGSPGGGSPGGGSPGGGSPGGGSPGGGSPGGGNPGGGNPGGETPGGGPGGGSPGGGSPGGGSPGGVDPNGEGPGGEGPNGEEPGGEEPGAVPPGGETPGGDASSEKILDVARGELGYQEGPGDANKYGPDAAWCSSFATWVWRESGVDIPSLPFTGDVYEWGQERGLAYDADNLSQARPGDVLLFGTGPESPSTSTHIGIVESVNGNEVTMIEGNSSDQVQRVTHELSSDTFYGGVHPR